MTRQNVIIIGAGPAGLTAAHEFLTRTDVHPIVLDLHDAMGGLARSISYKGNAIDIGGHRFFSKSDRVMDWWLARMPLDEGVATHDNVITYHNRSRTLVAHSADRAAQPAHAADEVMLLRPRKSRIYYLGKLFDYPIRPTLRLLADLGFTRSVQIMASYAWRTGFPLREEKTLEQFFINRFGEKLYLTFFKTYTEKVWGVPCDQISAEWGAQRIKGLSIWKALLHSVGSRGRNASGIRHKGTETSLIEQFLYPKLGSGQMWEVVAAGVRAAGGEIFSRTRVEKVLVEGRRFVGVEAVDMVSGARRIIRGDYGISTMPVKELVGALTCDVPARITEISEGLVYRDFIIVGLLLDRLRLKEESENGRKLIRDNWIYIHEPEVRAGRMQIFNNWSPFMSQDPEKVWIGIEYFCNESDEMWSLSDEDMIELAKKEMDSIGIIERDRVQDSCVARIPKTYPAYFGSYDRFDELRSYIDSFENLFLIGRNGMHRYNNQDHSMLCAMKVVDNILAGVVDKSNIWAVNTESDYIEERSPSAS